MQNPFVQKTCQKPHRRVVQPDYPVNVKTRTAVIPGTHAAPLQKAARNEFCQEDGAGVDSAAYPDALLSEQA